MVVLVTLVEQHTEGEPATVVIRATTEWEVVLALVSLQEGGLGVHLPVQACKLLFLVNTFVCLNIAVSKTLYLQEIIVCMCTAWQHRQATGSVHPSLLIKMGTGVYAQKHNSSYTLHLGLVR